MKALTLKEPWATAIFRYGKDIENRTWNTYYRGRILIHVSKSKPIHEDEKAFFDICEKIGIENPTFNLANCGLIIGSVELFATSTRHFSQYKENPWAMTDHYHWKLINPVLFDHPVPAKGRLMLWEVPASICNQLGEL